MREDISLQTTDGTILRGWHYSPDTPGKHPTIVIAHGFSAVKEMYLDKYAEAFAKAGFASVVYDNRNFGASDGEPRQEIDPWLQVRDYSDVITFALSVERTDRSRITVWGSSYSGGHVLVLAAPAASLVDQAARQDPLCGLSRRKWVVDKARTRADKRQVRWLESRCCL